MEIIIRIVSFPSLEVKNIYSSLERVVTHFCQKHRHSSLFFLATATATIGLYYLRTLKCSESMLIRKAAIQAKKYSKNNEREQFTTTIHSLVQYFLHTTEFQKTLHNTKCTQELLEYLESKLVDICKSEAGQEGTSIIVENYLHNFTALVSTTQKRINVDIQNEKLSYLEIYPYDAVIKISPLGKESHNLGKIPLQIKFKTGKSIVYKPRSMLPEKLICDTKEGILVSENFGTYKVLCCEDDEGEYGYSDFLENLPESNVVTSQGELKKYVHKLCVLEKISNELHLSDLHYQNIITVNLSPAIIDAEVFLSPPGIESGLFEVGSGAAQMFDLSWGTDPMWMGKNKIWILLPEISSVTFKYQMLPEDLKNIGLDLTEMQRELRLQNTTIAACNAAISILRKHSGRLILSTTTTLMRMQSKFDPINISTFDDFIRTIEHSLRQQGFQTTKELSAILRKGILQDASNHDIPVFYYDSSTGSALYHGEIIGRLPL